MAKNQRRLLMMLPEKASRWRVLGLGLGAGILAAAGQAPLGIWPLALLGFLAAFALFARAETPHRAAFQIWAFGLGYFCASLFWLVEPFLVDVAKHGWMAPFALLGMAGGLALLWGIAAYFAKKSKAYIFALAVALACAELIRAYLFTGFPWALIGYSWGNAPPSQIAAFIGPHGLVLATLLLVAFTYLAVTKRTARFAASAVILAALLFGSGAVMLSAPMPDDTDQTVRLIQPNAPQSKKWSREHAPIFFKRALDLTAAPATGPRPDIIIWPETSVPLWLDEADEAIKEMAQAGQGAQIIFGINSYAEPDAFNTLIAANSAGEITAQYRKHHLVPFGEYIPLRDQLIKLLPFLGQSMTGWGFAPGEGPILIDLGKAGRALPLICYEAIFPQDMRGTERADWLLQITNDAWFGRIAGPQQHLAQARMRAIEQGLPMVRAANTGISAVIDARGRLRASLPLNEAGKLDARLPGALNATPYARTGDWPIAALIALLSIGLITRARRESV
ncbi:MAG: apolipoprotein N-acyltransferase [Halocynthiibacter sp.]